MKTENLTKEFPSVFQDCQREWNFISSLIEVTFKIDIRELDVKSCLSCQAYAHHLLLSSIFGCCI